MHDSSSIHLTCLSWGRIATVVTAVLLLFSSPLPSQAAEIVIPLTVRFDVLTQALARQLYTGPEDRALVWHEGSCRYLYFDRPQFIRQEEHLRFTSHGTASIGTEIWGRCLSPLKWQGFIEVLVAPYITTGWQLRFRILDSNLYDEEWRKRLFSDTIWDITERFFLPHLTGFAFDLAPPREEVLSLVRTSVVPSDAARIEAVLQSVRAKGAEVSDAGVVVHLALTVPDVFVQTPPSPAQPEAPLTAAELETYQRALERWDAFLVFVVKGLGLDIADPQIREELFELLLTSRYELLPVLAGEVTRGEGDPVRRLFVKTWSRLRGIIQEAEQRGLVGNKILRYATFISSGDALLAIDRAAPGLGIEISADGLRRLARILRPEAVEDPLAYSLEVDPTLRTLFGFSPELQATLLPASRRRLGWVALAYAAEEADEDFAALRERLDRWVPKESESADYRSVVDKLLRLTADQELQRTSLQAHYVPVYHHLVLTTALQESCWRQFMRRGKEVIYLDSRAGSIGLMQINQHVWRGFYQVEQLKWNAVYNARAGAEILMRYLRKYGIKEGEQTGKIDNIARATWAVYNAGPRASGRYRSKSSSTRERRVDNQLWERYQGFAAGGEVDLLFCTVKVK